MSGHNPFSASAAAHALRGTQDPLPASPDAPASVVVPNTGIARPGGAFRSPHGISVTLSEWEFKTAVDVANARMATSNAAGLNHASTYARTYYKRLQEEIVGACGEMVFAKATGRYWSHSVNTFHHVADVGLRFEVRASDREDGCLIVRDNDADDRIYVAVFGEPPNLIIAGCILGRDAKRAEWVRDPHGHRPAWFVPQRYLAPLPDTGCTHCQAS